MKNDKKIPSNELTIFCYSTGLRGRLQLQRRGHSVEPGCRSTETRRRVGSLHKDRGDPGWPGANVININLGFLV